MKIGVIDLGSNAFNLLIWETKSRKIAFQTKEFVKVGRDSYYDGLIKDDAIERGVETLKSFQKIAKENKVEKLYAFATSAIRRAKNQNQVCNAFYKETGVYVNVIDGNEEARLIFKGISKALPSTQETSLIMDIGGGSAEFIIFGGNEVKWQESYPLGVARLLEMYHPSDPMTGNEKLSVVEYLKIKHNRTEAAILHYKPDIIIGSEGFFTTFYNVLAHRDGRKPLSPSKKFGEIKKHDLVHLAHDIIGATYNERVKMKGMVESRADTIQFAALSLLYILSVHSFNTIKVSNYSLKEGVIASLKENKEVWQESLL